MEPEQKLASIITGSRGIALATAQRLIKSGPVVLVGRSSKNLEEAARVLQPYKEVARLVGDVADPKTAAYAAQHCREAGWTPHNLILNAGVSKSGPTSAFSLDTWKEVFETNVLGAFNFLKEFLPDLTTRKAGTICLVPGTAGLKAYRNMAAYCASKHALVGLAKAVAMEARGVMVTSLCPGPVDTDMTNALVEMLVSKGMTKEAAKSKIGEDNPQKRLLTADDVANVVERICNGSLTVKSGEPVIFDTQLIQ